MQFMVQGAWGVIPAHISELAPDQVRGFLPGFSYQCGNLIAASIAWVQATLAKQYPYPLRDGGQRGRDLRRGDRGDRAGPRAPGHHLRTQRAWRLAASNVAASGLACWLTVQKT